MKTIQVFMESKTKQPSACSSAINSGNRGAEVINNIESPSDHWKFLEEIDAPMWADLSVCDLTNDETVDGWFNVSHEFHQRSSRQLISNVIGSANSINIQEPPSPKLPASVSKSRGKNYKVKQWEQRKYKAVPNKKHPVKTLTGSSMSTGSNNKIKPISRTGALKENQGPKACSSVESNTSNLAKQEGENSSISTLPSDHSKHREKKCFEASFQTSSGTSTFLSSLKINLRRSCATRPTARMVVANGERCSEGSSSNLNVDPTKSKKYILGDAQNKLTTLKAPALNVGSKVTTKGKVQRRASVGKVLMPRNNNKQNQTIDKEKHTASLAIAKETKPATMAKCLKDKSSVKTAQPIVHVQKASKESTTQKNGTKKPIGLKEKTANKSRDTDTGKPTRKVYFRLADFDKSAV